jgi:hypothetical protein
MNSIDLFGLAKNLQVTLIRNSLLLKNISDTLKRTGCMNLLKIHPLAIELIILRRISSILLRIGPKLFDNQTHFC